MAQEQVNNRKLAVMQLLEIVLLYLCTYYLLDLGFLLINLAIPGISNNFTETAKDIRSAIAVLVVGMPVYWWVTKMVASNQALTRKNDYFKWYLQLMDITLFLFAITIIIAIIMLFYRFLDSGLTWHYVLKTLFLIGILGAIFIYYIGRLEKRWTSKQSLAFAIASVLVCVSLILMALFSSASPFMVKRIMADQERVRKLVSISVIVERYWSNNGKLPASLQAITEKGFSYTPPTDPKTHKNYEFHPLAKNEYELCADFELPSLALLDSRFTSSNSKTEDKQEWQHGKGRTCFHKTLSPSHKKT